MLDVQIHSGGRRRLLRGVRMSTLVAAVFVLSTCSDETAPSDAALEMDGATPTDAQPTPDSSGADAARDAVAPGPDAGPGPGELYRVTFEPSAPGSYARADLDAEWRDVRWASLDRAEIVTSDATSRGQFLRIHYPAGGVGPGEGGAQWRVDLPMLYERLYVSYRVRFAPGFDFVRGGKLPGYLGGEGNTGGDMPDGTDGWSGRMMWREDGHAVQYLYHPDQPGTYGEDLPWDVGSQRVFDGTWHTVEHEIVMNTPGENDGELRGWWDGELALERTGLRYRDVDTFAIDGFYFSTFFGGGDPSWAPTRDEHVDFDTFIFSTDPITH